MAKRNDIGGRVIKIARWVVETESTIRDAAEKFSIEFGVSKSTVHLDLSKRLPELRGYTNLAEQTKHILEKNFGEKHIRGGMAYKNKNNGT